MNFPHVKQLADTDVKQFDFSFLKIAEIVGIAPDA